MLTKTISKHLQLTKIQTMNAFIYILKGKVYKKATNCCVFIKILHCTTSDILANPRM